AVTAPHRGGDAVPECGVEVFVEQVRRLHYVHIAIDEPVSLFHPTLPRNLTRRSHRIGGATRSGQTLVTTLSFAHCLHSFQDGQVRNRNGLNIQRLTVAERAKIEAVDPVIQLTDAGGWFDGEYRETWPAYTATRYLRPGANGSATREERNRLLADAEVVLGSWPFPLDLRARSPRLKWFHQRPAGASNLLRGDLWGSDVTVTTSRGVGSTLARAEYDVAGIPYFAKFFHHAAIDRGTGAFDPRASRALLIEGKPVCVVGAGGIGRDVGRLCAALGMRVVGPRRHPQPGEKLPP